MPCVMANHPSTTDAKAARRRLQPDFGYATVSQYAASTTATVNDEVFKWALEPLQPAIRTVPPWHDHPVYVSISRLGTSISNKKW